MQVSIRRYKERNRKLSSPEQQVFRRDSPRETPCVHLVFYDPGYYAVIGMKFNKKLKNKIYKILSV